MSKYIFRNEKGGYESPYDKNSLMRLCYEEIAELENELAGYRGCEPIEKELEYMTTERNAYSSQVEQLKQQLAEKESELKEYHDWLDQYHLNPYQIHLYITGLKVQLAEKEKEFVEKKQKEMMKSE